MKKVFVALSCAFSLCFISCASKPENAEITVDPALVEELKAASENETAEAAESQNQTTSNDSKDEEDGTETSDVLEITEETAFSSEDLPEPESFEEPEIITLEPEEAEEIFAEESNDEDAAEDVIAEEVVELESIDENIENETLNSEENNSESTEKNEEPENLQNNETDINDDSDIISDLNKDKDASNDDVISLDKSASNVIDITDDDSNSENVESEEKKAIEPSRSVTLKKFEYLDVIYPGTGWIYMGLTDNSKDIAYFGRKLGTKDTKFTLQARNAGTKIVHFYKNDPLTGRYLDDYIEIIVLAENGSNKTHIQAPEYKLPLPKKEEIKEIENNNENNIEVNSENSSEKSPAKTQTSTASSAPASASSTSKASSTSAKTLPSSSDSISDNSAKSEKAAEDALEKEEKTPAQETQAEKVTDSAILLQEAQVLYNEKEYGAALKKINQFFEFAADKRDEGLYLKGQILEAKSEVRDIKGAIDSYTSLIKNYPASKLWDSANKRIIYLKRFYLEVR